MMKIYGFFMMLALVFFAFSSCSTEEVVFDEVVQLEADIAKIDEYLNFNDIDAETHPSGFRYIIDNEGEGEFAGVNQVLIMEMTVFTLDSNYVFSTVEEVERAQNVSIYYFNTYSVYLSNDLRERQLPVLHDLASLLKMNGRARLFVPSGLAWGTFGYTWSASGQNENRHIVIPKNTNVLISVELVQIK
tara:strand:- start:13444 stop:14010 length:567 start_codon:yes stop_codon:yes gene_type:complete